MAVIETTDVGKLALDSPSKFVALGPGAEFMQWCMGMGAPPKDELLWEGPGGTGKTRSAWEGLLQYAMRYPSFRGAVVRATRKSMTQSVLALLENQVLGVGHPWLPAGRKDHWTGMVLPNGAEFAFLGMDDPVRLYSTEWTVIWGNEAQQFTKRQWQTLNRGLRSFGDQGAKPENEPPWRLLMGDFNPPHEALWICHRGEDDPETGIPAPALWRMWRHQHNPVLFDHAKSSKGYPDKECWTEKGVEYLGRMRRTMSDAELESLLYGRRYTSAGAIWKTYDPTRHRITGRLEQDGGRWYLHVKEWSGRDAVVKLNWFLASIDFGHNNPGCLQVWGFDGRNRMFRVAEVYRTGKDIDWWAEVASEQYARFRFRVGVADHDRDNISILNKRGGPQLGRGVPYLWRPWDKTKSAGHEMAGMDQVRVRFRQDSMYLVRDVFPQGVDQVLKNANKPTCLEEEIPQFIYPEEEEGKVLSQQRREHPDPTCANHACDAARGAVSWAFLKDLSPLPEPEDPITAPVGTAEHEYQRRQLERDEDDGCPREEMW